MIGYGQLPDGVAGRAFNVSEAIADGMTRSQLRRATLRAPHRGVRTQAAELTVDRTAPMVDHLARLKQRCAEYAPRMPEHAAFSGVAAAAILGLPVPRNKDHDYPVQVAVALKKPKLRTPGVECRRLRPDLLSTVEINGMRVLTPLSTFLTCCRFMTTKQATVMLDAVLTTRTHYPGLNFRGRPGATLEEVKQVVSTLRRFHGGRLAHDAVNLCKERVASPKETETRVLLVEAGLPEPEVNGDVVGLTGIRIAEVDLLYRAEKIAIEYEGDHHRTDKQQWRRDLERERDLRDLGFEYIRVTQTTLSQNSQRLVAQVSRLLVERAPKS